MSLVNRMLKDLSARAPASPDVMQGIQVASAASVTARSVLRRLAGLLALIGVTLAALWWIYGPSAHPTPQPRGAAQQAAGPPAVPATAGAAAVAPAGGGLRLATGLAEVPALLPAKELAAAARQQDDPRDAERRLVRALDADRDLHAAREQLVELRIGQRRLADARRSLNIGLGVAPGHAPYIELDRRLRELERSAATVRRAAAPASVAPEVPVDPAAADALARRLLDAGRADEAAEAVARTHAVAPDWEGYRRLAGRIEIARDRPAAALALLEPQPPALDADPEHHGLLASAYQRLDRHEDAARIYGALLTAQPAEGHWWAGLAISREALGDRAAAVNAYSQALQRGPLDPRVAKYVAGRLEVLKQGN